MNRHQFWERFYTILNRYYVFRWIYIFRLLHVFRLLSTGLRPSRHRARIVSVTPFYQQQMQDKWKKSTNKLPNIIEHLSKIDQKSLKIEEICSQKVSVNFVNRVLSLRKIVVFRPKRRKHDVAFLTNDERVLMFRSSLIDGQILGKSSAFVRAKKYRRFSSNNLDFHDNSRFSWKYTIFMKIRDFHES